MVTRQVHHAPKDYGPFLNGSIPANGKHPPPPGDDGQPNLPGGGHAELPGGGQRDYLA
jgi:hypothetical protein